jgi:hypothetical protein
MGRNSKIKNAFVGLLLSPFYAVEERERKKKLRERLARLEEKEKWMIKKVMY